MHPALLDLATGCGHALLEGFEAENDLYVAFSYGKLRKLQDLKPAMWSYVRKGASNDDSKLGVFDVTLLDDDGTVLVDISDFVMKKVDSKFSAHSYSGKSTTSASHVAAIGNPMLDLALEQGMDSKEGVEAFER